MHRNHLIAGSVVGTLVALAVVAALMLRGEAVPSGEVVARPAVSSAPASPAPTHAPPAVEPAGRSGDSPDDGVEAVAATAMTRVGGTVFDRTTRRPIAGARVVALDGRPGRDACSRPEPSAEAFSDSEGRYELELKEDEHGVRGFMLACTAKDYAEGVRTLWESDPVEGFRTVDLSAADFALGKGEPIRGRVVSDADGSPIAGARVGITCSPSAAPDEIGFGATSMSGEATSTSDGTFVMGGMRAKDASASIRACAAGFLDTLLFRQGLDGAEDLVIRMKPCAATITGIVQDLDGRPVAGASVYANQIVDGIGLGSSSAESSGDGSFSLTCRPEGEQMISAGVAPDRRFRCDEKVVLARGETRHVVLREIPMDIITVTGQVKHKTTGRPIAGVGVSTSGPRFGQKKGSKPAEFGEAVSGADGRYRLRVKQVAGAQGRSGLYLVVQPPEGLIVAGERSLGMPNAVYVTNARPGSDTERDILLSDAVVLRGRVVQGATNEPAAKAEVVYWMRSARSMTSARTVSGPDGKFEFNVAEALPGRIEASTETARAEVELTEKAAKSGEPIEVRLLEGVQVSGRVVDTSDAPIASFEVAAMFDGGESSMRPRGEPIRQTRSGPDGRFVLKGVPVGRVLIGKNPYADQPRGTEAFTPPEPVRLELVAGRVVEDVVLRCKRGWCLKGIVVGEDGAPIEGVRISADSYGRSGPVLGNFAGEKTDAEGRFSICGIPDDFAVNTTAHKEGYEFAQQSNVTHLAGEQRIVLKRLSKLKLTVLHADTREPVQSIQWRAVSWNEIYSSMTPMGGSGREMSETGIYELGMRTDVEMEMSMQVAEVGANGKPTGARGSAPFAPGTSELTVFVGGHSAVRGRVVRPGSPPVPVADAEVTVGGMDGRFGWSNHGADDPFQPSGVKTDAAGNFVIRGIGSGRHMIRATKGAETSKYTPVEVTIGKDPEPVTLELLGLGRVFGKVTGPDGGPLPGARITIGEMMEPESEHASAVSDGGGQYEIAGIAPFSNGTLRITAMNGKLAESIMCTIVPGEQWEYNFDFSGRVLLRGRITVNGRPPDARTSFSLGADGVRGTGIDPIDAEGNFEVVAPSGKLRLSMETGVGWMRDVVPPFELAAQPFEQTRDFSATTFPAAVAIVFADGRPIPPGLGLNVWVTPEGEEMTPVQLGEVSQTEIALPHVRAGLAYAALYKLDGSGVIARSPKVQFAPGKKNILIMTVEDGPPSP